MTELINNIKYKRVLLKISGEALMGDKGFGHDFDTLNVLLKTYKILLIKEYRFV